MYILDAAYIPNQGKTETFNNYKTRIYTTLQTLCNAASSAQDMRIVKMRPQTNWDLVWKKPNGHSSAQTGVMTWYRVIHDIIPTDIRLNRIRMTNTDACLECGQSDTLEHSLISCGEGSRTWNWLESRIARILRTSAAQIPSEWLTQPQFNL